MGELANAGTGKCGTNTVRGENAGTGYSNGVYLDATQLDIHFVHENVRAENTFWLQPDVAIYN